MHYRNGREAKPGDQVLSLHGPYSKVGYLVNLNPGSTSCNADMYMPGVVGPHCVTVGECLHMDDVVTVNAQTSDAPASSDA